MKIFYSERFLRSFKKLSPEVQNEFRRKENLFRQNLFHPFLKTRKLNGRKERAFLVAYDIRVIFVFKKDEFSFLNIGDHSIYRKK